MSQKRNQHSSHIQTQTQTQKQKQAEVQLQEYYVFQDLENVSNIFYETSAVLDYFNNDKNHPMVQLNMNRLITQLNLSNGIHYDTQENAKLSSQSNLSGQLKANKVDAKEMAKAVLTPNEIHKDLQIYLKHYLEINLAPITQINQKPSVPCKLESKFNEQTLSRVIGSMQQVDSVTNGLKNGNQYKKLTKDQLREISQNRKAQAIKKLESNFPKYQIGDEDQTSLTIQQSEQDQIKFIELNEVIGSQVLYLVSEGLIDTRQQELLNVFNNKLANQQVVIKEFDQLINYLEHEIVRSEFKACKQLFIKKSIKNIKMGDLTDIFRDNLIQKDIQTLKCLLPDHNKALKHLKYFQEFIDKLITLMKVYLQYLGQKHTNEAKDRELNQHANTLKLHIQNSQPTKYKPALICLNYIFLNQQMSKILEGATKYIQCPFFEEIHEKFNKFYVQEQYSEQTPLNTYFNELMMSFPEYNSNRNSNFDFEAQEQIHDEEQTSDFLNQEEQIKN